MAGFHQPAVQPERYAKPKQLFKYEKNIICNFTIIFIQHKCAT